MALIQIRFARWNSIVSLQEKEKKRKILSAFTKERAAQWMRIERTNGTNLILHSTVVARNTIWYSSGVFLSLFLFLHIMASSGHFRLHRDNRNLPTHWRIGIFDWILYIQM